MEPGDGHSTGRDRERDEEIERFWREAQRQARLETVPGYFGPSPLASLVPPAWAFGDDAPEADRALEQVLDGTRTAVSTPHDDLGGAALPEAGDLAILLDGGGHPRALMTTTSVEVVSLDQVTEEHARAEGETTLAAWREEQERLLAPREGGVRPDLVMVLERFRVLHPARESSATFRAMFGR